MSPFDPPPADAYPPSEPVAPQFAVPKELGDSSVTADGRDDDAAARGPEAGARGGAEGGQQEEEEGPAARGGRGSSEGSSGVGGVGSGGVKVDNPQDIPFWGS